MPTLNPWSWLYPADKSWEALPPSRPIEDGLEEAARRWPDAPAIEFNETIISFAELRARSARIARGLQDIGVRPGSNVALLLKNTPCHVICFYAILLAGARVVNLSNSMSIAELRQQLESTGVDVLFSSEPFCARLACADGAPDAKRRIVICSETESDFQDLGPCMADDGSRRASTTLARLAANSGEFQRHDHGPAEEEVAVLQFTGGTTGIPKAAMLTHANFSVIPHAMNLWAGDAVAPGGVLLVVLPLSHVFGLVLMCLSVANGLKMILHASFDADRVLDDVAHKDVSIVFGVPMMFAALAQNPRTRRTNWSRVRICGSGGSPLSAEIFSNFRESTGLDIREGYSLTEITDLGTWQLIDRPSVRGTVGIPFPHTTVEIVDLDTGGKVLPIGEIGEVCFQGPQLMKGYWNRPEETAQAMRGGRFHTGDVGLLDGRGYLTLVDRKKDMLIVGGNKVFSKRVEAAIGEHPAVAEACLIGVPSAEAGHIPKAFVTLRPGHTGLKLAELKEFLRDRLGRYEMPLALEVVAELPRTDVGKIAKDLLIRDSMPRDGGARPKRERSTTAKAPRGMASAIARGICQVFAEVGDVKVTPRARLESSGATSLTVLAVHDRLLKDFPQLPSSVFFEFGSIAELATHMAETFSDAAARWLESTPGNAPDPAAAEVGEPRIVDAPSADSGQRADAGNDYAIAIIGLSGRYAKARTLDEYWENLKSGRDCMSEIPAERWSLEEWYTPTPTHAIAQGKSYCKWVGYLDGFAEFDPFFFGIAPKDALAMDPQERQFVQCCWEALEDAAYTRDSIKKKYRGSVGVFAGITNMGYDVYGPSLWAHGIKLFPYTWFSSLANRVSFLFDLHGPSMPIDTMCSSSITAIHEACHHIRRGECDMAFAGGVNIYVHPAVHSVLSARRMISVDGRSKAFGVGANGYAPGEGVGVVLLKRLSAAIADGDHIHAVIRGTSINHGGRTNGYRIPSPAAQADLIRLALDDAGVNAREISYVEAHGTGTELGDPIEISGLHRAFSADTDDKGFCAVGSVKTNIGHCESAAGVAGLTKVILQMKHATLVPSLHAETINPRIDFASTAFWHQKDLADWNRPVVTIDGVTREMPRMAGISSFGAGGANAHMIVEEYIPKEVEAAAGLAATAPSPTLIVLSAGTTAALGARAAALAAALARPPAPEMTLANIAFTLQVGREAMRYRLALVASSIDDLRERLLRFVRDVDGSHGIMTGEVAPGSAPDTSDDDDQMLDAWTREGDLVKLARCWLDGREIDWELLTSGARRQRLPLPVHRFEGERYWIPDLIAGKGEITVAANVQITASPSASNVQVDTGADTLFFCPRRQDVAWPVRPLRAEAPLRNHWILFASLRNQHPLRRADSLESAIARAFPDARAVDLGEPLDSDAVTFEQQAERLFTIIQEALRSKDPTLLQVIATATGADSCLAGLSGMLATAAMENPNLIAQLVLLATESPSSARTIETLKGIGGGGSGTARLDDALSIERFDECALPATAANPWRDGGVYLISGGGGGIGLLFAEEIARRTRDAAVVLVGRGELASEKSRRLDALRAQGLRVHHLRLDVGDAAAVQRGVAETVERFGRLDGVLHAAGVIRDNLLARKSVDELHQVLMPKVAGLRNLDEATRDLPLTFFVCFSSTSALGNVGQADYATANAFLDAYVGYRNELVSRGKRHGATISINWPMWQDGGMTVSSSALARMKKEWGVVPLPGSVAMDAFARVVSSGRERVVLTYGEADKLHRAIAAISSVAPSPGGQTARGVAAAPSTAAPESALIANMESLIKQVFTKTTGIELSRLDADASFNDCGIDSILIMDMVDELEKTLGPLSKTLFFEYPSISKLTRELAGSHGAKLASTVGLDRPDAPTVLHRAVAATSSVASSPGGQTARGVAVAPSTAAPESALIANMESLIKQVFTKTTGIEPSRLDADASFNDCGIDSILIMDMVDELEKTLGPLSKTLFFEYPSISRLTRELAGSHGAKLASTVGLDRPDAPAAARDDIRTQHALTPLSPPVEAKHEPGKARSLAGHSEPAAETDRRFNGVLHRLESSIDDEPIAVIGVRGFYPGAADLESHWRNLEACADCIVEIDPTWATEQMFHPDPATALTSGRNYCKWGGRLNPSWAAGLDTALIPKAMSLSNLDPIERMFLCSVHDLLRDARYDAYDADEREARPMGLFVCGNGASFANDGSDYAAAPVELSGGLRANRISYMFDLCGPSMAVDTMSSSSLAAVHYACSSLRHGECRSAIAGGFSILSPDYYRLASQMRFLGSRANSRSFTAGDGYLPGECAGAVLLKPLRFAEEDGDNVLALIRSTVTNHTGRFIAPFTPNPRAQSRLVEMALKAARVEPRSISYVESAANGSVIGDAVEFSALSGVFRSSSSEAGYCALGSIKANIGHAAAASGISQLTKVVLQLQHGTLVPTRLAGPLNPDICFQNSPFRLPDEAAEWRRPVMNVDGVRTVVARRALVNSFGAGGSYVSAVLEEYGRAG